MPVLTCFKAYDIRGELGTELDEDIAYRIGRAYAEVIQPQRVVVGGDVRLTSEALKLALADGLRDAGWMCMTSACPAPKRSISPPSISGWTVG
ncbi:Phosphoglucosamine mutase [Dickeya solani]|nr:Phosphoglucosamine mutase [Dickeya solani]